MSSKRRKGRSRSPLRSRQDRSPSRGNPRRSSIHRQYRYRDDYDRYGCDDGYRPHRYDASNRSGQDDDRNRSDDRGPSPQPRRRNSSQASQHPHRYMALRPSRAPLNLRTPSLRGQSSRAGRELPYRDDRPKEIPQTYRDKCGACKEGHDIRFCPYPNTKDGRTKICPICDTSKHAWYTCEHYNEEDTGLQWIVCWTNRRGLSVIVHNASLHELFYKKVHLGNVKKAVEDRVRALNMKPGPLSPAFVKRLMPPQDDDDYVQQQLREGRRLPWELEKEDLESNMDRLKKVIEDPETENMQLDKRINGTKTTYVPKAGKLKYFRELHQKNRRDEQTAQQNSDVYKSMESLDLRSSFPKRPPRIRGNLFRTVQRNKFGSAENQDAMKVTCGNCGTEGHRPVDCPDDCRQCGQDMRIHRGYNGHCNLGACLCCDNPGHTGAECDRPCRLCFISDKGSSKAIKDCSDHCQYHVCLIENKSHHVMCVDGHGECPQCQKRHWHQDCPEWLATVCAMQDCRTVDCKQHCSFCGGPRMAVIWAKCPSAWKTNDENSNRRKHIIRGLVDRWHLHLEQNQWTRQEVTDGDICKDAWCQLRCKKHNDHLVTADSLWNLRLNAWRKAVTFLQQNAEGSLIEAALVLAVPECQQCFALSYTGWNVEDFQARNTGEVTEWGKEFLSEFPVAREEAPVE